MTRRWMIAGALALAAVAGAVFALWPRDLQPAPGTTLVLSLSGDIPESLAPLPLPAGTTQIARWLRLPDGRHETPLAMLEIWRLLDHASRDPRIARLRVEPRALSAGWAKLEELRAWIAAFATSAKPVEFHLRAPGMKDYFVATAHPGARLTIAPSDWLNLRGLRAEVISLKGTLDKLGIVAEIESAGRYKDAGDMVTRTAMSPETREVLDSMLDARLDTWTRGVAHGRRRTPAEVNTWIAGGPYLAKSARERGIVDALEFPREDAKQMDARVYRWALPASTPPEIAVVIIDEDLRSPGSARRLAATLRAVDDNASIRGLIVRVDSPGGEVTASDEMLHLLQQARAKRPLVFSFSATAASGAYALAMTGDRIHATPGTVTGSIGVLFGKADISGLYAKLGIHKELITRGPQAALDSEVRPLGDEGRRRLRAALESLYADFVAQVAAGRRLDVARVRQLAEGRVWLGTQARERQLIDELDGFSGALADLRRQLKLGPDARVAVWPQRESWLERGVDGPLIDTVLMDAGWLESLSAGTMQRRMPYRVDVR